MQKSLVTRLKSKGLDSMYKLQHQHNQDRKTQTAYEMPMSIEEYTSPYYKTDEVGVESLWSIRPDLKNKFL